MEDARTPGAKASSPMLTGTKGLVGDITALSLLLLMTLVILHDTVLTGKHLYFEDLMNIGFPFRHELYKMGQAGKLHFWNPHIFCGMPFLSDVQTAYFYPLSLIFYLVPTGEAIVWHSVIHLWLAAVVMYLFARRLVKDRPAAVVAGLAWALGGFFVVHVRHLAFTSTGPWLPLILLFILRLWEKRDLREAVYAGLVVGFLPMAGNIQFVYYFGMVAIPYFIMNMVVSCREQGRAQALRLGASAAAIIAILSLLIPLVQFLPALAYLPKLSRAGGVAFEFATAFSLTPKTLLLNLIPYFFGQEYEFSRIWYWGDSFYYEVLSYVGLVPLVLAIFAVRPSMSRQAFFMLAVTVLAVLIGFGHYLPVYKLLWAYLPYFNVFRNPARFIMISTFGLAVLSAFGLARLRRDPPSAKHLLVWAPVCLAALLGLGLWAAKHYALAAGKPQALGSVEVYLFVANLIAACLLVALRAWRPFGPRLLATFAIALVCFDLAAIWTRYNLGTDPAHAKPNDAIMDVLSRTPDHGRVLLYTKMIHPNPYLDWSMVGGFETVRGYNSSVPAAYWDLLQAADRKGHEWGMDMGWVEDPNTAVMDLLNVQTMMMPAGEKRWINPKYQLFKVLGGWRFYSNMDRLPRAFAVHTVRVVPDPQRHLQLMSLSGEVDFRNEALLFEAPPFAPQPLAATLRDRVTITKMEHDDITVEAQMEADGLVILADTYDEGWEVTVDGQPGMILKADYLLRAVPLRKGHHTLQFHYTPVRFHAGLTATLMGLLLAVILLLCLTLRARRAQTLTTPEANAA